MFITESVWKPIRNRVFVLMCKSVTTYKCDGKRDTCMLLRATMRDVCHRVWIACIMRAAAGLNARNCLSLWT